MRWQHKAAWVALLLFLGYAHWKRSQEQLRPAPTLALYAEPIPLAPPPEQILDRLAHSIARHEGWGYPTSPVRKLHNPGALVYVGQATASRAKSGYARFASDEDGWSALLRDLKAKIGRGLTLRAVMAAWNRGGYLADVVLETGLNPDAVPF